MVGSKSTSEVAQTTGAGKTSSAFQSRSFSAKTVPELRGVKPRPRYAFDDGTSSNVTPPTIDVAAIRRVPLFCDFADEEVAGIAETVTVRRFGKHQFIVREGDSGDTFFILIAGSVAVCRIAPDGRETILAILKGGDFFGEMTMFDSSLRSASIKTLTEVEVGAIRQADFLIVLDRSPRIGRSLVTALSERLRAANALITLTSSQDIRARLATLLLNLSAQFGEQADNGTRIALRLTNQEMANMIATTRETVNRTLNRFCDDKLVDMRGAQIIIVEPDRLGALIPQILNNKDVRRPMRASFAPGKSRISRSTPLDQ